MGQKLLVPLGVLALVVLGALAFWFLMPGDSPNVNSAKDNTPEEAPLESVSPLDINPEDFKPEKHTPDPVVSERPAQPFEAPTESRRFLVSGRVVFASGIGVADAQVHFFGEQKLRDWRASGFTDDMGYYRIVAWAPDPRGTVASDAFGRVAAETSDGAIAVSESTPIPDGDEVIFPDVVLAEAHIIEGQILTESGEPVPGAQITARSAGRVDVASLRGRSPSVTNRPYVTSVTSDATGRYSFKHMPPAEYGLTVAADYFGENLERTVVDIRNAPSAWQDLTVKLSNHVRGRVVDDTGQPVGGAVVQLRLAPKSKTEGSNGDVNDVKNTLEAVDRTDGVRRFDNAARLQPGSRSICVTDAAGRFGFGNRGDGNFELVTRVGESETRLGDVKINQPDYTLEVKVSTLVSGVVRSKETGLPVESYDIRIFPGEAPTEINPFDRIALNGRFAFHPGGYYMFANPPAQALWVRVSAPGYAPAVVNISDLKAGDARRDIDVELHPLCDLTMKLTLDGAGLDFEPVAVLFDDRLAYDGCTNEIGVCRLLDVAPQTYKVRLISADGTKLEGTVVVPSQREASVEVKLSPAS